MADDELIGLALFNNRWDQLSGYEVECGNCGNDFTVDTVEY